MRNIVALVLLVCAGASGAQKELLARLSEEHRTWVEEEVRYIITDRERELFLSLDTLDERSRFITSFWAKRDPNLSTPVNEYRAEHYERLQYANKFLGRESFLPGWRTDRGRYYILLGKPRTIQRFYGVNGLKEAELWFYQGEEGRGIPSFFYLLFYKREEVGDYRLYHPVMDGPASLMNANDITPGTDNLVVLERLEEINVDLAHAALSYDTGEPPDYLSGRAAIGVDAMLARIDESPKRAINTDYLDAWAQYGKRVSAEYSFNFVASRHVFSLMVGPEATPIVHFSVELDPSSFGLLNDEDESKYYTTLDVTVEATDSEGKLAHTMARSTYIELTPAQVQTIQTAPVAYQDDFPLIPGKYTVSVILRNRALKNYTVAEAEIEVPSFSKDSPALADVILCHDTSMATGDLDIDEIRTFQFGGVRLDPATGQLFAVGETINVFTQAYGAPNGSKVVFELITETGVHDRAERPLTASSGGGVTADLSTLGMIGGNYRIRTHLIGPDESTLDEKATDIVLSPRTAIPRAEFTYRRGFNAKLPGLLPLVRGDQLWSLGRFDEAKVDFEAAVAAQNPNLPHAKWKLAAAYLRENEADPAIALLAPIEAQFSQQFEVMAGLGLGHYLKNDYEKTVGYLERAITIRPPDTSMLNALADSHQRLGHVEEAKSYFERSLALDPAQEAIKKRLAGLDSQG